MAELNLDNFNPKMAEVKELVDKFKNLTISGVKDTEGYKAVHEARMTIVRTRTGIVKTSKKVREDAVNFNKAVLKLEKDLIAILDPAEERLATIQKDIDKEKERLSRFELIPMRREKLSHISPAVNMAITDEEIVNMDGNQFQEYLNNAKHQELERIERRLAAEKEAQEAKILEEQAKLAAERAKLGEERRLADEREAEAKRQREAAIEELRLADLKAKQDKERAVQEEKDRADREKRAAIEESNKKLAAERARAQAAEEEIARKKAAEKKAEDDAKRLAEEKRHNEETLKKKAAYQEFLKNHGVTKETSGQFFVSTKGNIAILWKKVGEFNNQ